MQSDLDKFYHEHIKNFGATAQGVGWKNEAAQHIRFEQFLRLFNQDTSFSLNDLGCGVGDLVNFLDQRQLDFSYRGYDVMPEMIALAKQKFTQSKKVIFQQISDANQMSISDYTIASGIFNISFNREDSDWLKYILSTIAIMNEKSVKGFSFNMLTKYSDAELMKKELYYADPCFIFDYCKRNFSKNVALLHDYYQYDFTIVVRKI